MGAEEPRVPSEARHAAETTGDTVLPHAVARLGLPFSPSSWVFRRGKNCWVQAAVHMGLTDDILGVTKTPWRKRLQLFSPLVFHMNSEMSSFWVLNTDRHSRKRRTGNTSRWMCGFSSIIFIWVRLCSFLFKSRKMLLFQPAVFPDSLPYFQFIYS